MASSSSSSFTKNKNSKLVTTPLISIPVPLVAVAASSSSSTSTTPRVRQQPPTTTIRQKVSPRSLPQQQQQLQQTVPKKSHHQSTTTTTSQETLWITRGQNNTETQDLLLYCEERESSSCPVTTNTNEVMMEERFQRFQEQAMESIKNLYEVDNLLRHVTNSGALTTSLPEDCIALLHTLVSVLQDGFLVHNHHNNQGISPTPSSLSSSSSTSNMNNTSGVVTVPKSKTTTIRRNDDVVQTTTTPPSLSPGGITRTRTTGTYEEERTKNNCYYFRKGLVYIIQQLRDTHQKNRTIFVVTNNTVEDCCAAANDFLRLSELLEQFWEHQLIQRLPFLVVHENKSHPTNDHPKSTTNQREQNEQQHEGQQLSIVWNNVISIMLQDAVVAAEYCQHYLMVYVVRKTSIGMDLFSTAWEMEWTSNEPITTLINLIDDHLNRVEQYMCPNPYLYHKAIIATVKAIVCFYVRCLIIKADSIGRNERIRQRSMGLSLGINTNRNDNYDVPFHNHQRALLRMRDDIKILSNYFRTRALQDSDTIIGNRNATEQQRQQQQQQQQQQYTYTNSALQRIISNEMWILETIYECLQTTSFIDDEQSNNGVGDNSSSSLESFIVVLHKRTGGNTMVTRFLMSDLWYLSNSQIHQRGIIRRTVNQLQNDLQLVTTNMINQQQQTSIRCNGSSGRNNNALSPLRQRTIPISSSSSSNTNDTMSLFIMVPQLEEMLRSLYEDRLAQGILPLCWMSCHPRGSVIDANDDNDDNDDEERDNDIDIRIARKIQHFTQQIVHFPHHLMGLVPQIPNTTTNNNKTTKKHPQQEEKKTKFHSPAATTTRR